MINVPTEPTPDGLTFEQKAGHTYEIAAGVVTDLGPLPRDIVTRFWDRIGLCSCGNPQTALRQLLDALERHNPPGPDFDGPPLEWVDEGSNLLVCYVLDSWRLAEHGSSVYGAWLTAEGVALRDALRVVDLDSVLDV